MRNWIIKITAWVDERRKVDEPYRYEVDAERAHTAVHRAMMMFHEEIGRFHGFDKLTTDVERGRPFEDR